MTPHSLIEWLGALDLEVLMVVAVVPAMLAAALGAAVVRWLAGDLVDPTSQVTPTKVGFVAQVYSVLLGFLVVAAYAEFSETRGQVLTEAATLAMIDETAQSLGDATHASISGAVQGYAIAVVEHEWPELGTGGSSDEADAAAVQLLASVSRIAADAPIGVALASARLQDLVREVRLSRVQRLAAAPDPAVAWLLSWALGTGTLLALGIGWLLRGPSLLLHMILSALLVGLFLSLIVTAVELIYPFSGSIAISSEPFLPLRD